MCPVEIPLSVGRRVDQLLCWSIQGNRYPIEVACVAHTQDTMINTDHQAFNMKRPVDLNTWGHRGIGPTLYF